ncbi:spore germination protein GerPC [Bacillus sp. FJAT-29790]|uniref:spore germination protein GerPC n=1 Tax=Bacillus sp. FJAT-29790 TaxID=1895002 RepID=UPI001C231CC5|nr:spore germination protein GerPC [Bacillus sp. FJAT-29790]MBU8877413.1 spore germination protein GerPC [Bacillus sp. FJAT-29790]
MNQELYYYLQKLHAFIEAQEKRIGNLEKKVMELEKETKALKGRPPVRVDKIEYKFDQLKVESLDGTLNIGLNPAELQEIEDFAVNNQGINTPNHPKVQFQRTMEIEDEIYKYLENDLPLVIKEIEGKMNTSVDESYITFIKEDIKKQLPNRIDLHLKQFQASARNKGDGKTASMKEQILEQLKKEIQNGVQIFISNLPNHVKGMNNE